MSNTNKASGSKKLILTAFLIGLSVTATQAVGRNDLEPMAKSFASYARKSSLIQQGAGSVEHALPEKNRIERHRYIPPATTWDRFKQKCSAFLDSITQCFTSCVQECRDEIEDLGGAIEDEVRHAGQHPTVRRIVQQLPPEVRPVVEEVIPTTTWNRFKQRCSELLK